MLSLSSLSLLSVWEGEKRVSEERRSSTVARRAVSRSKVKGTTGKLLISFFPHVPALFSARTPLIPFSVYTSDLTPQRLQATQLILLCCSDLPALVIPLTFCCCCCCHTFFTFPSFHVHFFSTTDRLTVSRFHKPLDASLSLHSTPRTPQLVSSSSSSSSSSPWLLRRRRSLSVRHDQRTILSPLLLSRVSCEEMKGKSDFWCTWLCFHDPHPEQVIRSPILCTSCQQIEHLLSRDSDSTLLLQGHVYFPSSESLISWIDFVKSDHVLVFICIWASVSPSQIESPATLSDSKKEHKSDREFWGQKCSAVCFIADEHRSRCSLDFIFGQEFVWGSEWTTPFDSGLREGRKSLIALLSLDKTDKPLKQLTLCSCIRAYADNVSRKSGYTHPALFSCLDFHSYDPQSGTGLVIMIWIFDDQTFYEWTSWLDICLLLIR